MRTFASFRAIVIVVAIICHRRSPNLGGGGRHWIHKLRINKHTTHHRPRSERRTEDDNGSESESWGEIHSIKDQQPSNSSTHSSPSTISLLAFTQYKCICIPALSVVLLLRVFGGWSSSSSSYFTQFCCESRSCRLSPPIVAPSQSTRCHLCSLTLLSGYIPLPAKGGWYVKILVLDENPFSSAVVRSQLISYRFYSGLAAGGDNETRWWQKRASRRSVHQQQYTVGSSFSLLLFLLAGIISIGWRRSRGVTLAEKIVNKWKMRTTTSGEATTTTTVMATLKWRVGKGWSSFRRRRRRRPKSYENTRLLVESSSPLPLCRLRLPPLANRTVPCCVSQPQRIEFYLQRWRSMDGWGEEYRGGWKIHCRGILRGCCAVEEVGFIRIGLLFGLSGLRRNALYKWESKWRLLMGFLIRPLI